MSDRVHDAGPAVDAPEPEAGPPGRRRTVLWVAGAVGVAFAVLSVVFALRLGEPTGYRGTALLGEAVPPLELPRLDGTTYDLAGQRGDVVVINFFNSWCVPCKEEEPALRSFHAAHADDPDFEFVGIVRDDTEAAVRSWAEEGEIPWPVLLDPGGRAAVDFATTGQPETYVVAPNGAIVARHLGRATLDDLERMLAIGRGQDPDTVGAR